MVFLSRCARRVSSQEHTVSCTRCHKERGKQQAPDVLNNSCTIHASPNNNNCTAPRCDGQNLHNSHCADQNQHTCGLNWKRFLQLVSEAFVAIVVVVVVAVVVVVVVVVVEVVVVVVVVVEIVVAAVVSTMVVVAVIVVVVPAVVPVVVFVVVLVVVVEHLWWWSTCGGSRTCGRRVPCGRKSTLWS